MLLALLFLIFLVIYWVGSYRQHPYNDFVAACMFTIVGIALFYDKLN